MNLTLYALSLDDYIKWDLDDFFLNTIYYYYLESINLCQYLFWEILWMVWISVISACDAIYRYAGAIWINDNVRITSFSRLSEGT